MNARHLTATGIALVLAASVAAFPRQGAEAVPAPVVANDATVPATADNFLLVDHTGFGHELHRYRDAPAIVLVSQANGDTASRKAAEKLIFLHGAFKNVPIFMINSSLSDTRSSIAAEAKALGIDFPILDDDLQLVGEHLGITQTAEAFVIDPITWKIVYHGAVDASLSSEPGADYFLTSALLDAISRRPSAKTPSVARGTPIAFPGRDRAATYASISYSNVVAPILEAKCVACHQTGGIGPFPMSDYETVKGFSHMIREVIRTDRMPPWHADDQINNFQHDKSLTTEEIKTIVHWIEAGSPRGDGSDPLASAEHVAPDWPLGPPDVVVDIPAYKLPASGIVDYQYPFVANVVSEGKWLKASTIKGGVRQGVHHVLTGVVAKPPASGRVTTSQWGASVGGYAVGSESIRMPASVGTYIPAGAGIGFQMHYTPFGKEAVDQSKIGLYFYGENEKPDLMMRQSVVIDTTIEIPPGEARHQEIAYLKFPKDALLYSVFPHAHYRGVYTDVYLQTPDGKKTELMATPHYDFNWQREYEFTAPVRIPAGSKLVAHYIYDNSPGNRANPDPKTRVLWGEQSHEEMLYSAVRFRWLDETVEHQTNYDELMDQTRLVGMMDDNLDERLQLSELRGRIAEMIGPQFTALDTNKDAGLDLQELAPFMQASRGRPGG